MRRESEKMHDKKACQIAMKNTKYNAEGKAVIEKDDDWRNETEWDDMYNELMADRVRYFKEDEEGVAIMCREMEKMRDEAVKAKQLENIKNVMESFQVSVYKAMESLKIPTEMYDFYLKKLNIHKS